MSVAPCLQLRAQREGASAVSYLYDYRHRHYNLNNNVTYLKVYAGVQFHKRKKFRSSR